MNVTSRITLTSKLPGFEDVKFSLNKMTEGRRIQLRLKLAEVQADVRRKMAEAKSLAESPDADTSRVEELLVAIASSMDDQISPAWVRWGLRSISGLNVQDDSGPDDVEGNPAFVPCETADALIAFGPRELYEEIVDAIKANAGLSDRQLGESVLPTTSPAPVAQMSNTSATVADATGISSIETAA